MIFAGSVAFGTAAGARPASNNERLLPSTLTSFSLASSSKWSVGSILERSTSSSLFGFKDGFKSSALRNRDWPARFARGTWRPAGRAVVADGAAPVDGGVATEAEVDELRFEK